MHPAGRRTLVVALAVLISASCAAPRQEGDPAGPTGSPADPPSPLLPDPAATLVASAVTYPDVYAVPVAFDVAVYADGSVYTPGSWAPGAGPARYVVRRLTPEGLASFRAAVERVVGAGGDIGTDPPPGLGAGFNTYEVRVLRDGVLRTATTTSLREGDAAVAIRSFAERWQQPGWTLPGLTWAQPVPVPYESDTFVVRLRTTDGCCRDATLPDAATAIEPVLGPVAAFGQSAGPGDPVMRCGHIDAATRRVLAGALAANGAQLGDGLDRADVEFNEGPGVGSMTVVPLLPGADGCTDQAG